MDQSPPRFGEPALNGWTSPSHPASEVLEVVDLSGNPRSYNASYGPATQLTGSAVCVREVDTDDGIMIQRWVPAEVAAHEPQSYLPLENEVRAATRLALYYSGQRLPFIAEVVGHALNAAEPFLLVRPPSAFGTPVSELMGSLLFDDQRAFRISLLRALAVLARINLIHGDLTSGRSVRWDGQSVQLTDFGYAAVAGDRRQSRPDQVWAPAEQRDGTGLVHPADDIWAAAVLMLQMESGRPAAPDLAGHGPAIAKQLEGVFAASAQQRPTAETLLARFGATPYPVPVTGSVIQTLAEGRRVYDEVTRGKFPAPPRPQLLPSQPPAAPVGVSPLVIVIVVVLILAVAAVIIGVVL